MMNVSVEMFLDFLERPNAKRHFPLNPRDFEIYHAADNWRSTGTPNPKDVMDELKVNEKTLAEHLQEDDIDLDAISFIAAVFAVQQIDFTVIKNPFEEEKEK